MVVDQDVNPLPTTAAPGVAARAEALAETACELYDLTASNPQSWSAAAAEDAVESVETTLLALRDAHPDVAPVLFAMGFNLNQLRQVLGLPPRDEDTEPLVEHPAPGPTEEPTPEVPEPTPLRQRRRRVLGPGYQGVRIPPGLTASGR